MRLSGKRFDSPHPKIVDLCLKHGILTTKHYGKNIEIVNTWNNTKREDYPNGYGQ